MPVVSSGDAQIVWDEQGKGDPLLLVMGHRFPRTMWFRTVHVLAKHFRVITFDNRGAGESTVPRARYTMHQQAKDAMAVLDAAGVNVAHVYGVSMGGMIAQTIAVRYPDRVNKLVLGCTIDPNRVPELPQPKLRLSLLLKGKKAKDALTIELLYGAERDRAKIAEDLGVLNAQPTRLRGTLGQRKAMKDPHFDPKELARIDKPTLILHGDADVIVPLWAGEDLASRIPGSRLVTYPGAGHMYLTDYEDQANADVLEFLKD